MKAAQRQMVANVWTKPIALKQPVGCQLTTLTIAILLLLSSKADTHFTVPRTVEGWVDLGGWLYTEMVYLPTDARRSAIQVITGPSLGWSRPTRYR